MCCSFTADVTVIDTIVGPLGATALAGSISQNTALTLINVAGALDSINCMLRGI